MSSRQRVVVWQEEVGEVLGAGRYPRLLPVEQLRRAAGFAYHEVVGVQVVVDYGEVVAGEEVPPFEEALYAPEAPAKCLLAPARGVPP